MVVADDQRGGIDRQRSPGDFARMHFGAVHGALEQLFEGQHPVTGIEEECGENLMRASTQALGEVATCGVRIADRVAPLQRGMQQARTELEGGGQSAGAGRSQAGEVDELGGRTFQQGAQRTVVGEQFPGGGHGVAPTQSGTQEDGEQFRIAETGGPTGQQLLAGTFVVGPVADVHAVMVDGRSLRRHRALRGVRVS